MAEFCKDCFKQLLFNGYEDLDLCEGCGEFKQVVIKIIDWIFSFTLSLNLCYTILTINK